MYYTYFGLKEAPFSIAPNPHYLFMTDRHQEALAHLYHGVSSDAGFVLLTGDVGTGKTTVCRRFLSHLPENTQIAFILNPCLNDVELLQAICQELHISAVSNDASLKQLTDLIYQHLLSNHAQGVNTVLLIDEAQQMHKNVLELIRLLTNLETDTQKLLKIILVGQPELNDILAQSDLIQLSQRITARYHIRPLTVKEISTYIKHRLQMAGYIKNKPLFSASLVKQLFVMTQGVPRLINVICDRALLGAYSQGKYQVNKAILKKAFYEVKGNYSTVSSKTPVGVWLFVGFLFLLCLGMFVGGFSSSNFSSAYHERIDEIFGHKETSVVVDKELSVPAPVQESLMPAAAVVTPIEIIEKAVVQDAVLHYQEEGQAIKDLLNAVAPSVKVNGDYCKNLKLKGWRCDHGVVSSWQAFKKYNRPSILTLEENGFRYHVAIIAMSSTHGLVLSEQGSKVMPLIELGEYWVGEFTYLWRSPLGFKRYIYKNSSPHLINDIAQSFAVLDKRKEALATDKYNDLLKKRIQIFQQKYHLKEDGKAGIETLLKLNEALGIAITLNDPKLMSVFSDTVN